MNNYAGKLKVSPVIGGLLARAFRAPLWLFASSLLARVLGPTELGTWAMILSAAMLGNQVFLLWTQAITQKYGREEFVANRTLNHTWSYRRYWIALGFFIIGLLILFFPFEWTMKVYGLEREQSILVIPVIIGLWLMGESQSLQQVREHYSRLAWAPVFADLILIVLITLIIFYLYWFDNISHFLILTLISCLGAITWAIIFVRELHGMYHCWIPFDWAMVKRSFFFAIPLVPGYIIGYLAEWCDYFLIEHFYSKNDVGLFHPAYQYMLILVGMPAAFAAVLLPQLITSNSSTNIKFLIKRLSPQLFIIWGVLSFLIMSILPSFFDFFLGDKYVESNKILRFLLIAVPGAIVVHIYSIAYFIQSRLYVSNIYFYALKLIIDFLISFSLIPWLGIFGAAIGTVVSYIFLQWIFLYEQQNHMKIQLKNNASLLAFLHFSAIILAFIDGGILRLSFAVLIIIIIFYWSQRNNLFSNEEINSLLPERVGFLKPILKKCFVSIKYKENI